MKVFHSFRALNLNKKDQAVTENSKVLFFFYFVGEKEVRKIMEFSL